MMELLQRGDLIQASLTKFSSSYTTTDPGCECYDLAGEHFNPSDGPSLWVGAPLPVVLLSAATCMQSVPQLLR